MATENILEIENLTKYFGDKCALDNVSFKVEKGSICGLLGPNGAGKTTLLRIINGIMVSDSGEVRIKGEKASLNTSRMIGYMPEERGLYDNMRVDDQIIYFGLLHGGDKRKLSRVMNEYLSFFNLTSDRHRKVKELSKGNQQKVQIISTLVHDPDLIILDEPFSGFDPINGALLQQLIAHLQDQGTTIMLSSHNMPAIEDMCSDIALINKGSLLVKDSIEDIKEANKDETIIITTSKPIDLTILNDSGVIKDAQQVKPLKWRKGNSYQIKLTPGKRNVDLLDEIAIQSDILHFEEVLPSLTDIFLCYTSSEASI